MNKLLGRVYYGWVIVAVLAVASMTQVGEFNPVLAVFIKPFADDFGWSRAEVSLGITLGSLGGGLIGPIMGPLIDRYGSRQVLVLFQMVYGTCLLSLTFLNNNLFYFLFAYSLGRMVVQGGTSLAIQIAIVNWFRRLRGRAMGITNLGTRVGQAILPGCIAVVTEVWGWRYAWLMMGIMVWLLAIIPSVLFLRRRPEDMGLLPDGATAAAESALAGGSTAPREEPSWTLREALHTRSLWFLLLASAQSYFLGAGINLHLYPYLTDVGLEVPHAVLAAAVFFSFAGFGAIAWGTLLERFPLRYCLSIAFCGSALGIVILLQAQALPVALLFGLIYGLSFGGLNTMISIMWAAYYGRENVGTISGAVLPAQLVTNAMGPLFGGWMFDTFGNYHYAFAVYIVFALMAALWSSLAGPPRSRPTPVAAGAAS